MYELRSKKAICKPAKHFYHPYADVVVNPRWHCVGKRVVSERFNLRSIHPLVPKGSRRAHEDRRVEHIVGGADTLRP
jgi:hypothetical protein